MFTRQLNQPRRFCAFHLVHYSSGAVQLEIAADAVPVSTCFRSLLSFYPSPFQCPLSLCHLHLSTTSCKSCLFSFFHVPAKKPFWRNVKTILVAFFVVTCDWHQLGKCCRVHLHHWSAPAAKLLILPLSELACSLLSLPLRGSFLILSPSRFYTF